MKELPNRSHDLRVWASVASDSDAYTLRETADYIDALAARLAAAELREDSLNQQLDERTQEVLRLRAMCIGNQETIKALQERA